MRLLPRHASRYVSDTAEQESSGEKDCRSQCIDERQNRTEFFKSLGYTQRPGSSTAASSLQPTDASCRPCPTEALVVASLDTRAGSGNTAHLQFDAVPRRDLCKSVEDVTIVGRERCNQTRSPFPWLSEGDSGSGVRCPQAHAGGRLCGAYRAAHHRSCREQRQSSTPPPPQKGRREAHQRTYTQTWRPTIRKQTTKGKTRLRENACCPWRVMSETYRQQAFGQPTFTDAHASGSSSGRDLFDIIDAANLYHDHDYQPGGQHLRPLRIPSQNDVAQNPHIGYALHSSGVSAPSLQYTSPTMPTMTGHILQHYEHDATLQIGFDDLQGFSPVTQGFHINAYRTPYPDSNATSTSSATSPDPTNASLLTDPVVVEAEEDKRKRNQAASARFRQKKKQREMQLMEASREMQDRTKKLEAENDGLRKENTFLKKLLVEKVDHMSDEDRELLKKAAEGALAGVIGKKS